MQKNRFYNIGALCLLMQQIPENKMDPCILFKPNAHYCHKSKWQTTFRLALKLQETCIGRMNFHILTNSFVYELVTFVSGSSFLIVTHTSKQEKRPVFKRSPCISTGHSNKYVRFNSRSILNNSFNSGSISVAFLCETKKSC